MDLGWARTRSHSWLESVASHLRDISQHPGGMRIYECFGAGWYACMCEPVFPEAVPTLGTGRLEYNCKVDALTSIQSTYWNRECLLSPPTAEATVRVMHLLVVVRDPGPLLLLLGKMQQVLFSLMGLSWLLPQAPLQFSKQEKRLSSVLSALECQPCLSPLRVPFTQIFKEDIPR